ncbi:DNA replication/repair protein RecF [Sphingomicrobium lutaoense]|uniref:DNA replication and repair protein RecF n=1 Tax=Sphingomicrobium lutaoense TaxID=515949 RepID=A0A839Z5B5_9SPHN|nr:DNA replication/repair protein RecF [Sphingomicrobium lutaoense]MBB3764855.1 DNA replication and repair protein RecF [Sphingomicrobium lutaoense]
MISRLALTDFRNHEDTAIAPGAGFVMLSGNNGAGKTNMLEAVSLFSPGRGMRRAPLREMARQGGPGNFSIAASLGDGVTLGTGTLPATPDRRQLRINGAAAPVSQLGEWLSVLWLTPAMDRLFTDSAGGRRRFLDRLVLALEPSHARHASRYEAAMRARNKLLAEPQAPDPQWLAALEAGMAEHGEALAEARAHSVAQLNEAIAAMPEGDFPRASLALDGWSGGDLARALQEGRGRDARAGRALAGPHRQDLLVTHIAKQQPAALGSTGEQKALLLGLVLAHADVVAERRGSPPILLLDEVAAHLDPGRRAALYARLEGRGQTWMTATEGALFEGLSGSHYRLDGGTVVTN